MFEHVHRVTISVVHIDDNDWYRAIKNSTYILDDNIIFLLWSSDHDYELLYCCFSVVVICIFIYLASITEYKYTRARSKHINMWNITQNILLTRCHFIGDCKDNIIIIYYRIMDYDRHITVHRNASCRA